MVHLPLDICIFRKNGVTTFIQIDIVVVVVVDEFHNKTTSSYVYYYNSEYNTGISQSRLLDVVLEGRLIKQR